MVTAHRILNKSEIMQMDYVNFMLEAAASSAKFGVVREVQPAHPDGVFVTRANINAMLVMPFGSGKSTSFIQVSDCVKANDMKFSGMVGTINKDGEFNPGSIMKAAGKLLVIDEFQKLDDATKDAMNSLLEYPHTYSRNLGLHVKKPFKMNRKNVRVSVKEGTIDLYAKFSCISGGMWINKANDTQKAWFSRFVPIVFNPSLDYYEKMTAGQKVIRINPKTYETDFEFNDFLDFHKEYWKSLRANEFLMSYFEEHDRQRGYVSRNLQDVTRIACFIESLNEKSGKNPKTEALVVSRESWELAMRFQGIMMMNSLRTDLTEVELAIVEHQNMTTDELAKLTGTSKSNISHRRKELREVGLLKEGVD